MNPLNVFWTEFLQMYKSLPVLWKVNSENYCNRVERAVAYDKLVNKLKEIDLDANVGTVQRKINCFRTSYRRELKKAKINDEFQPTLWYFDLLHFITDQEEHSKEESTMSDDDSVSDRSNETFEPPVQRNEVKEGEILKMAKFWDSRNVDQVFWSEFLEVYKSLPILWKVKRENHCNRLERADAYNKLVDKLKEIDPEANKEKVQRKLNSFKSSYRRELKKSEIDNEFQPTLWYFDLLHFITDQEEHSKEESTMSDDDSVSARRNEVFEPPVQRKKLKEVDTPKMPFNKLKISNDTVMVKVCESQCADKVFWSEFLEMYKSLPVLWKVNSENYFNRVKRAAAYDKLVEKLKEIDPEANRRKVQKKINSFRTSYKRELKKMKKLEKSGVFPDGVFQPTLWYFDLIYFLEDQEVNSKMESAMSDDDSVSDSSDEIFEPPVKRGTVKEAEMASEKLDESNDDAFDLAEDWASQYAKLGNEQRVLARKIWADVLFHGRMNRLTEKVVEDIHQALKDTSNTSTLTPHYEEYSYSPEPQFTFVAYEQNDEPLISLPTKSEQCEVIWENPSTDLPSTSTTRSLTSRCIIANNEVFQRSSLSPLNLKEEIEENIEELEYEDMKFEVDDYDLIGSIDHEDDHVSRLNIKNLCQNPEDNRTSNAEKVAVTILNQTRESKLKANTRRKYVNWKKLSYDEARELKRLKRTRDCVCDQCGRHFTDLSNLKQHLVRHSGIRNHECKECKAKFYTAYLLKRHSLLHRNSPPTFPCQYCERKFFSSDLRLHHERSHTMERQFDCQYCNKSFFTQDQQRKHEKDHTRIRKYHCKLCDVHFFRRTHLTGHYNSKAHKNNEQRNKLF